MTDDDLAYLVLVENRDAWGLGPDDEPTQAQLLAVQGTAQFHAARLRLALAEAGRSLEVAMEDVPALLRPLV